MIAEKVKYIAKDLPRLDNDIKSKSEQFKPSFEEEADLSAAISRSESFGNWK